MWFSNRVISTQARDRESFLLFQPAEEDGSGAKKVFSDIKFAYSTRLFACNNLPGYQKPDQKLKMILLLAQ
jgi:metal-dependent amidase/aminoacylase/carboxypeptidase family protein